MYGRLERTTTKSRSHATDHVTIRGAQRCGRKLTDTAPVDHNKMYRTSPMVPSAKAGSYPLVAVTDSSELSTSIAPQATGSQPRCRATDRPSTT